MEAANTREKQDILLETGTNEMEIMEFTVAGNTFGINVAKIREIMMSCPVTPMPHSHPSVEGVFKPRDIVITVIDLPGYLGLSAEEPTEKDLFIITNFNQMHIAFRVHTVEGIDRISWQDIEKPDATIYGGQEGLVTGLAQFQGHLITILDFEKIVTDIAPETGLKMSEVYEMGDRGRDEHPIVIAEDSVLLSKMILEALHQSGYENVKHFDNGQEAWDYLESLTEDPDTLNDNVNCVITDIEMPKMDGHRLTRLIKENKALKHVPVVIFSSLVTDEMRLKGEQVGANEQLSKPEIGKLVHVVDSLVGYEGTEE
ncbi:chemotaxis protein [Christensenellaceae bacterium OttesenSCG-928-K19]|nr:chemotaxis protein [Christensenellaceae bacterium OttesenSCG-928-K19]